MPSTAQFSRPLPGMMSSGSMRTRTTAALDLAIWSATPSSGSPSSSPSKMRLGLGVDQVADLEVAGPDRGADDVADDAHALLPDGVLEAGAGVRRVRRRPGRSGRGRAAARRRAGRAGRPRRAASCGPAGAGRCRTPRGPCVERLRASPRGPRRRSAAGWRYSTISWSRHQLAGPLDDADADEQQGAGPGRGRGRRLEAPRPPMVSGSSPMSKREVGDDEQRPCRPRTARTRSRPGARRASRPSGRRRSGASGAPADPGWRTGRRAPGGCRPPARRGRRRSRGGVLTRPPSSWSYGSCGRRSRRRSRPGTPMPTQPGEQALGHRAEAAEAEAAVAGLLAQRVEVGDDVALLLGRAGCRWRRSACSAGRSAWPRRCACALDVASGRARSRRAACAPPEPAKLWQAVQLVRKIWPPRAIASSRSSSDRPSRL